MNRPDILPVCLYADSTPGESLHSLEIILEEIRDFNLHHYIAAVTDVDTTPVAFLHLKAHSHALRGNARRGRSASHAPAFDSERGAVRQP